MTGLQKILLMIISDVDRLLRDNDIPYFLDGGSALGAVRHKGFIPWDDDLDICIMPEYYDKFVEVCRTRLDAEKYTFEEGEKDWPLPFCKIKLNGTTIEELDAWPSDHPGIYIDIFFPDYARKSTPAKFFQFLTGRLYAACFLARKPYTAVGTAKKTALKLARFINRSPRLYRSIRKVVRGAGKSDELALTWDRTRSGWKKYFYPRALFEESILMDFEDLKLPICKGYHEYLTQLYGHYMQLPPEEKRVGLHLIKVDFGKYAGVTTETAPIAPLKGICTNDK